MFERANEILSEAAVNNLLSQLLTDHSYTRDAIRPVDSILQHWREEGNRFIGDELAAGARALAHALRELSAFTAAQFFVYPRNQGPGDKQMCMKPAWNVDREGLGTAEESRRYDALQAKLDAACERTRDAYREYRRTVKRNLLV